MEVTIHLVAEVEFHLMAEVEYRLKVVEVGVPESRHLVSLEVGYKVVELGYCLKMVVQGEGVSMAEKAHSL